MTSTDRLPPEVSLSPEALDADRAGLWPALRTTAESALPDFLMHQRWYPAKDVGRPTVQLMTLLPFVENRSVRTAIAVWKATPPGRPSLRLFVPLALVAADSADPRQVITRLAAKTARGSAALVDACSTDDFLQAWVDLHIKDKSTQIPQPLRLGHTERLAHSERDPSDRQIKRSSAEQSNTSVRIGDNAILKIIRKLEEGVHPELEVCRYLTAAGFPASPPLLSWIDLAPTETGAATTTLSILQSFVPNAGDGWKWILERLARAAHDEPDALEETYEWVRTLARRTAELHRTFAEERTNPDFRPEPVSAADLRGWAEAAGAMAERAFASLKGAQQARHDAGAETHEVEQLAEELTAQREGVMQLIQGVTQLQSTFTRTRHHGDFHLGQVLVSGQDAVIIDFEGEPLRPLAERRAKHAVLRDVAGMLRSFAYAAQAAARALPTNFNAAERQAALTLLERWRAKASDAFVADYFSAMEGVSSIPPERADAERLLRFFLLEKALYEVSYEMANRPDWVSIPLRGVLDLMRQGSSSRTRRVHSMSFGAEVRADGRVRFRMWGPSHSNVSVALQHDTAPIPMRQLEDGWHELVTDRAHAGSRYSLVLQENQRVPDPASRFQPEDVHGPSEVIDPAAYVWQNASWQGRPWEEAVVYELHVGTYTPEGSFRAIIDKLDHLAALGVTAIELMPIADFPGKRNWGYDGVVLVCAGCRVWPARGVERADRCRAWARPDGVARCSLQPLRPGRRLYPCDRSADLHRPAPDSLGRGDQRRWRALRGRSGSSSSTMRCTGSRSFISTACGSMRSTRSWTTARSTCWRSWLSACAQQSRIGTSISFSRTRRTRRSLLARDAERSASLVFGAVER